MTRPVGHETYRVEHTAQRSGSTLFAVCSCGWRSETYANGGFAGSAWDRHIEEAQGANRPTSCVCGLGIYVDEDGTLVHENGSIYCSADGEPSEATAFPSYVEEQTR